MAQTKAGKLREDICETIDKIEKNAEEIKSFLQPKELEGIKSAVKRLKKEENC